MGKLLDSIKKDQGQYSKMFNEFGQAFKAEIKILTKKPPQVPVKSAAYLKKHEKIYYYELEIEAGNEYISNTPCVLTADNMKEPADVQLLDVSGDRAWIYTSDKIQDDAQNMILHIGEKVVIQELARCLIEKKTRKCPAGEAILKESCSSIRTCSEKAVFRDPSNSTEMDKAIFAAMENDVTIISTSSIGNRLDAGAQILYNLYKQKRNVLYLAEKNADVDRMMSRLWELYDLNRTPREKSTELSPFIRIGCTVNEIPEELLPESHARIMDPELFEYKDAFEGELLEEDIRELEIMLEEQEKAKADIVENEKIISELQGVLDKTLEQIDDYRNENVIKRKLLISNDYELDKDIRMSKIRNKVMAAREAISRNNEYLKEVRMSKPYYDKEMKLLKMRRRVYGLERNALKRAWIAGTTMTMSFLDEDIKDRKFDTVVIDSAESFWIPALWHAGYLSESSIILLGDMGGKPGTVRSRDSSAKRWLNQSIFRINGAERSVKKGRCPDNLFMI